MKNYKSLNVWKKSHELVLLIYKLTSAFPRNEQYILTSQIRRASISIPNNIAEGCGKYSQADFVRYLQTSLGSTQEVEYLVFLSRELRYLKDDAHVALNVQINTVKAMLINLINKIRKDSKEL
jgi:four helix bundle protein